MIINKLTLQNFRGYSEIEIPLHEGFNLIIGDNGSGKTSLLEALTISMGSLFLGIRNTDSRHILSKDMHIRSFEDSEEYGGSVVVMAEGIVNGEQISWSRELTSINGRTLVRGAHAIKSIGANYDALIRQGETVNLPVLAYYATGRLFDEARDTKEKESKYPEIASRLRAYNQCLKAKMTFKKFIKWFRGKQLARATKGTDDIRFDLVRNAIINNVPDCENIYYELDPDKPNKGLKVELADGRTLPFSYLSDGTRNFLALIADIAYKCVTLNPHLKENALLETTGIVLIDELDLHLHPEWQKRIIKGLRDTFPKVQFVCTTHSPFLIQETEANQLIKLKGSEIEYVGQANNQSIEDIAEEHQDVENPQWSKKRQIMYEVAKEYYSAVKEGTDTPELKEKFDEAMKPFANDTALYAVIDQEKIKAEYKKRLSK
ncbi:AAA family ATPase [Puteibacter caeruleilacunae]|nr:AAA family ATPase [Puteibacter caeruleilacunae]